MYYMYYMYVLVHVCSIHKFYTCTVGKLLATGKIWVI